MSKNLQDLLSYIDSDDADSSHEQSDESLSNSPHRSAHSTLSHPNLLRHTAPASDANVTLNTPSPFASATLSAALPVDETTKPESTIPLASPRPESPITVIPPTENINTDQTTDLWTALFRPPPLPGKEDWGIPPEPAEECDPEVQTKFSQWHELMQQGASFNSQLLHNKKYRNPHIYAKLIEFLDLDETGSNFPTSFFDPKAFTRQAYAEELARQQDQQDRQRTQRQQQGDRTHIVFSSSSEPPSRTLDISHRTPGQSEHRPPRVRKSRWGPVIPSRETQPKRLKK
ncbi:SAP30-binding protein [Dispira simplex]|nr:SAP30-binding protein [Dispira simplex]